MRTSAKNFMLSFALVGGMLCTSSSVAMAQGRHRANSTTSAPRTETRQSAPQSRQSSGSVNTGRERPSATMSQSASQRQERTSTSRADRQERVTAPATRSTDRQERAANAATRSTERQERTTNATTRPDRQVSPAAGSTRTEHRNINSNSSWSNSDRNGSDRNGSDRGRGNNYGSDRNGSDRNGNDRGRSGRDGYSDGNSKPGGNNNGNYGSGSDRGRNGNNYGSDRGRGNNNGNYSNRGGYDNDRGRSGNNYGSDRGRGNNRFRPNAGPSRPHNYANHPHRDQFSRNYAHHNWSRPLPPPRRAWRPAYIRYYRPVVPVHYRPYYGAPVIDRILGITFGTLFNVSLDYLYGNGYYIDGYENDMVYLRDVTMLNLLWPDVMLRYDSGRLACAQFAYSTGYNDRSRYNRIYHDLCGVYGPPVSVEAGVATWFGGNTTGWVTLSTNSDYGRFYTTLSIGY